MFRHSLKHKGNQHILQKKGHESKTDWPKRYCYHAKIFSAHCISFSGYSCGFKAILKLWAAPKTNKGLVYTFWSNFSIKNSGLSQNFLWHIGRYYHLFFWELWSFNLTWCLLPRIQSLDILSNTRKVISANARFFC